MVAAGLVRGEYHRYVKGHDKRKTPHEYVEEDRGYTSPCWIWTRGKSSSGYGVATGPGRKNKLAHRVYYEERYGPIPDGLFLDHLCRQHACVNPDHLEAVAPRQNSRRSSLARLGMDDVLAIRASTDSHAALARRFSISETAIRDIRTGRTWKDLSNDRSPEWTVYTLSDPETGIMWYIGKSNDVAYRYRTHLKPSRSDTTARASWVRTLRERGLRPVLAILGTWPTDTEARAAERAAIGQARSVGLIILNDARGEASTESHDPGWSQTHRFRLHPEEQRRGSAVGTAKLTEDQVREMRKRYDAGGVGTPTLGREFGVSTTMAHNIVKRLSWKHVA